jgi:hypothetical protein
VKIVQHTNDVLVLRSIGSGLVLGLFGLIFFVVGVVSTFAMGQAIHLTCERLGDRVLECEVKRTFL